MVRILLVAVAMMAISSSAFAGSFYLSRELAVDMVREVAPDQVANVLSDKSIPVSENQVSKPEVRDLILRHADPDRSLRELLMILLLTK